FARHRWLLALGLFFGLGIPANAAPPADAETRAKVAGTPLNLAVEPATITLSGPRATRQVLVTGTYADGSVRDLTPVAELASGAPAVASGDAGGFGFPHKNGTTDLVVQVGGKTVKVNVTVKDCDKAEPVSFRRQVIAALNVGGCNAGACHGTPS